VLNSRKKRKNRGTTTRGGMLLMCECSQGTNARITNIRTTSYDVQLNTTD